MAWRKVLACFLILFGLVGIIGSAVGYYFLSGEEGRTILQSFSNNDDELALNILNDAAYLSIVAGKFVSFYLVFLHAMFVLVGILFFFESSSTK